MSDSTNSVFDDRFSIKAVDSAGKKFDKVARIEGSGSNTQMQLTLDIASEVYPINEGENIALAIVRNLVPEDMDAEDEDQDGLDADAPKKVKREMWRSGDQGLAADYDYVMYGKVYKFDDAAKGDNQTTAYFSFGGLLMALRGSYRHLSSVTVGENVYLLIRKA